MRGDAQRAIDLARDALADITLPYRIGVAANRWAARAAALIDDGCVCAPGHEAALGSAAEYFGALLVPT